MMRAWSKPFKRNSPCWRERIVDAAPAQEPQAEPEMPRGQMIHLLRVRMRTAGEDSLIAKALRCLEAVGSDEPTTFDTTALRDAHFTRWNYQGGFDELLPPGQSRANEIARKVARDYQLHHITFHFKQPRSNTGAFASCSCGGWSQTVGRTRSDENRLRQRAAEHLDAVAHGTWKRPRPIEDFLNEVMPPRFDFSGRRSDGL